MAKLDITKTVAQANKRRPFLVPLFDSFAPLLVARKEVGEKLDLSGFKLPIFEPEKAKSGRSLLGQIDLSGTGSLIRQAAQDLLPILLQLDALKPYEAGLRSLYLSEDGDKKREELAKAIVSDMQEGIIRISWDLPPEIVVFSAGFIVSAVFRAIAAKINPVWNEEGAWQAGHCPVCGSMPVLSWLDRPKFDENNAFLVGGGGKKHFYCDLCGAEWIFRRSACPSCAQEGSGALNILSEEASMRERIVYCNTCKHYCPEIDLREFVDTPDFDALGPSLLHLDILAAERELHPLKPSFWNMF